MAPKRNGLVHAGPRAKRALLREERQRWIKEIAYYKAMDRRFTPGHELLDWLAAEQEVDAVCMSVSVT
jgi:hypothetical protein